MREFLHLMLLIFYDFYNYLGLSLPRPINNSFQTPSVINIISKLQFLETHLNFTINWRYLDIPPHHSKSLTIGFSSIQYVWEILFKILPLCRPPLLLRNILMKNTPNDTLHKCKTVSGVPRSRTTMTHVIHHSEE